MSDIKSQFRTFIKSRSIGEMFRNTTWEMIQCIAFIPALIFIISPVLQLMINFIFPYDYAFTIDTVSLISCLTGAVAIIMFAGKKIVQKNKLTGLLTEYLRKSLVFITPNHILAQPQKLMLSK